MVGMQKYMERVQKAKKLKEEKEKAEEKAFKKGKNWTPSVTQPTAPKLTAKRNQYLTGAQGPEDMYTTSSNYNSGMNVGQGNLTSHRGGTGRPKSNIRQSNNQGVPNNAAQR